MQISTQKRATLSDARNRPRREGVSDDLGEQERIASSLGTEAHTLIMRNHGACCTGSSVGQAWVRAWYLEKVCQVQLRVLQTGRQIRLPSQVALAHAGEQTRGPFAAGIYEWAALVRYWERKRDKGASYAHAKL